MESVEDIICNGHGQQECWQEEPQYSNREELYMIAINQVKSEIPWNGHRLQIRDMIDSEEVLRKKAAAALHIDAVRFGKWKL